MPSVWNAILVKVGSNILQNNKQQISPCKEWGEWSGCEANCMRTRSRTCAGGDECAQSRKLEEACDDGLCNQGKGYIYSGL